MFFDGRGGRREQAGLIASSLRVEGEDGGGGEVARATTVALPSRQLLSAMARREIRRRAGSIGEAVGTSGVELREVSPVSATGDV
jgi:hypothetical protein